MPRPKTIGNDRTDRIFGRPAGPENWKQRFQHNFYNGKGKLRNMKIRPKTNRKRDVDLIQFLQRQIDSSWNHPAQGRPQRRPQEEDSNFDMIFTRASFKSNDSVASFLLTCQDAPNQSSTSDAKTKLQQQRFGFCAWRTGAEQYHFYRSERFAQAHGHRGLNNDSFQRVFIQQLKDTKHNTRKTQTEEHHTTTATTATTTQSKQQTQHHVHLGFCGQSAENLYTFRGGTGQQRASSRAKNQSPAGP